jgi:hypothetical protein
MVWKLAGVAVAAAAIAAAPIAAAQPNSNGTSHANDQAQTRGISVAGVAGSGPSAVLGAIQSFAPSAAQSGLSTALSHVPTPTTTTVAPTP